MLSRIAVAAFAFCVLAVSLLAFNFSVPEVSAVPTGFTDEALPGLTGVSAPGALAFTPDGRLLIATKGGRLMVYQNSQLTQALDLGNRVCVESERGLLGVAVDPQFATNRHVYLFYTFNRANSPRNGCVTTNSNTPETSSHPVNRVSRFTFQSGGNTIDSGSEMVLVDGMPSPAGNHNAGDLNFGKDGFLYITIGDGGCDYAGGGCAGTNNAARDMHVLTGKILRITKTGDIPAGNPFTGTNTARCNVTGRTDSTKICQEIYATGLRNPFRFAFDSNASGTRFFINDVGQGAREEIDEGAAGADYGWNVREGFCANGGSNCGSTPPAGMTNPIFDYPRGCVANTVSGNSITGGAFVPNGVWASAYDDSYLIGEYVCGKIFRIRPNGTGGWTASVFSETSLTSSIIAMTFGPYQPAQGAATQALYYATHRNGGEVRRIRYTGSDNRNPIAAATANPTSGAAPLDVSFNASASSDADGDSLTFSWNFGDGTTGSGATPTHRYQNNGTYNAVVTVTDGRNGSDTATVRIVVGNNAPQPTINSPTSSQLFRVGETITLQGSATDLQDGALPASALRWEVLLHHNNDHTHPFLAPTTGNNITFTAPAPEDLAAATGSFLEIRLTATDSSNLSTTVVRNFQPRKVNITFATNPAGLNLTVNGTNVAGGTSVVSWDGYGLNVNAPAQTVNGNQYAFQSWSDGGAQSHTITTPATGSTYTAAFRLVSSTVSGTITYAITPATLVSGVNLNATGPSQISATSNSSGFYQLAGLNAGGNYNVTPSKTGDANGIEPFDAVLVLRYVAAGGNGVLNIDQLTAADCDGNGMVDSFDAAQILRFVAAGSQNADTGQTGNWKFSPPSRPYNSVSNSFPNQNYEAFLMGDVDGDWSP